eukprot:gb/GFBE01076894.1/.p1 GENE.gb/GFBE01076894.1/~~gb/GFBE01076894.1/.p1  ORF type:complete len:282 (+),score=44.87 gb/GFBE01076894.1/:1-846(+)
MFEIQGWFGAWPLFCSAKSSRPIDCLGHGEFWPFVILHGGLFYGSALLIILMKQQGKWPDHTGFDAKFSSSFYVAWHIPMIIMSIPLGLLSLAGAYELWMSGDPIRQYGSGIPTLINEAATWFTCYFALDTLLMIIHQLGSLEMYIHHLIFGSVAGLLLMRSACPMTGAILIAQELSTPALNTFTLLRAYKGLDNLFTQATFLIFAMLFYAFRVILNTIFTLLFLREVFRGFLGPSNFSISAPEQLVLAVALLAGAALQLHWGRMIGKKIYSAIAGDKKAK